MVDHTFIQLIKNLSVSSQNEQMIIRKVELFYFIHQLHIKLIQIHSLNCLHLLMRDATLSNHVTSHIDECLLLAVKGTKVMSQQKINLLFFI